MGAGSFCKALRDNGLRDNAAGEYAGQPLKANCVSSTQGLTQPALCICVFSPEIGLPIIE